MRKKGEYEHATENSSYKTSLVSNVNDEPILMRGKSGGGKLIEEYFIVNVAYWYGN